MAEPSGSEEAEALELPPIQDMPPVGSGPAEFDDDSALAQALRRWLRESLDEDDFVARFNNYV